jgi:WD40 repeat protein
VESQYKLVPKITISDNTSEVFCVKFSTDGKYLAAGCGDGAIRVFSTTQGKLTYNLQGGSNVALPTTALQFRPVTPTSRTKNVLLAANAAGAVQHWHMTSGKCLHSLDEDDKEGNQVYALDYNDEGSQFVTAGKDKVIRIWDEATKSLVCSLAGGIGYSSKATPGHSNRVFSTKFKPGDENMVISGGWDNTVQIWDLRVGHSVRSIFGPHICGDSLDVQGNEIVTGSWRQNDQLQTWDFGTGKLINTIPWNTNSLTSSGPSCMLYATCFSKEGQGRFNAAGGSGANEAKVFDHHNNNAIVGTITGLTRGVFTMDFSPDGSKVAVAGGDSSIRILDVVNKASGDAGEA